MTTWREAVEAGLSRWEVRHGKTVERADFLAEELDRMVSDVGSVGDTPGQTVSRVIQELASNGRLTMHGDGTYRLN